MAGLVQFYKVVAPLPIVVQDGGAAISYAPNQIFSASPKLPSILYHLMLGNVVAVDSGGGAGAPPLIKDEDLAERYIKANGTRPFTGHQSLDAHRLTDLLDPVSAQDAATKAYVDLAVGTPGLANSLATPGSPVTVDTNSPTAGQVLIATSATNATWQTLPDDDSNFIRKDGTIPLTANWSVGGFKLSNLLDPTLAQDAATKNYVDTQIAGIVDDDSTFLKQDGSRPLTANWSVGGFKLTNLLNPTNPQDAATKAYADSLTPDLSGVIHADGSVTWTADQSVGGHNLTNIGSATASHLYAGTGPFSLTPAVHVKSTSVGVFEGIWVDVPTSGSTTLGAIRVMEAGDVFKSVAMEYLPSTWTTLDGEDRPSSAFSAVFGSGGWSFVNQTANAPFTWAIGGQHSVNEVVRLTPTALDVASGIAIGFAGGNTHDNAIDAGLSRLGAASIGVGNGAVGNTSGRLTMRTLAMTGSTSGTITIQAPATAGTQSYTLPSAIGSAGQVLTDAAGNGILSWQTPAASGTSLDGAYDFGGLGAGRIITADAGAVEIDKTSNDSNLAMLISVTAGSGNALSIGMGPTTTGIPISVFVNPSKAPNYSAVFFGQANVSGSGIERATISLGDYTPFTTGIGPGITFTGTYTAGSNTASYGGLKWVREDSVDGNLHTRAMLSTSNFNISSPADSVVAMALTKDQHLQVTSTSVLGWTSGAVTPTSTFDAALVRAFAGVVAVTTGGVATTSPGSINGSFASRNLHLGPNLSTNNISTTSWLRFNDGGNNVRFQVKVTDNASPSNGEVGLANGTPLVWYSGEISGASPDTGISRPSANNLAIGNGSAGDTSATVSFRKLTLTGSTSGSTSIQAAATAAATYTLPATDGTGGYVLSTNGAGVLAWVPAGGGGTSSPLSTVLFNGNTTSGFNIQVSNGDVLQFSTDAAFSRLSSASVALGNGSVGDATGTLTLKTLTFPTGQGSGNNHVLGPTDTQLNIAANTGQALNLVSNLSAQITNSSTGPQTVFTGGLVASSSYSATSMSSTDIGALGVIGFLAGATAAKDTGFSRASAATVALGNGTAGNFSGTLKLTAINANSLETPSTGQIFIGRDSTSAGGRPVLFFKRSRSGGIVNSGDLLGDIIWHGVVTGTTASSGIGMTVVATGSVQASDHVPARWVLYGARSDATIGLEDFFAVEWKKVYTRSDAIIGWSSSSTDLTNAPDTAFSRTAAATVAIGNGTSGDTSGTISLRSVRYNGATSGTVSFTAPTTAGTQNYTWPTTTGTFGYVLSTDGSGGLSWVAGGAVAGAVSSVAGTANQVLVNGGTSPATGAVVLSLASAITSPPGSNFADFTPTDGQSVFTLPGTPANANLVTFCLGGGRYTMPNQINVSGATVTWLLDIRIKTDDTVRIFY